MRRFWTAEEDEYLKEHYPIEGLLHCQEFLNRSRSRDAIKGRARNLGVKGTKTVKKTQEVYKSELPKDIQLVGTYINNNTSTKHLHTKCGRTWDTRPRNITSGTGCPHCSATGYTTEECYLYFIYLNNLGLYKLGITGSLKARLNSFGHSTTLIASHLFSSGIVARDTEQGLLTTYKRFLYNSGELNSGNTETLQLTKLEVTELLEIISGY